MLSDWTQGISYLKQLEAKSDTITQNACKMLIDKFTAKPGTVNKEMLETC